MILKPDGTPFPASSLSPRAASPFIATQQSPGRGVLWTFSEDTRRQLDPWSRMEMTLKSRTMFENSGCVKALLHLARLVGWLKPQACSGDDAWDALAEPVFEGIANSPRIFDAGGRWTFATIQTFSTFRRFLDGDCFAILTETTEGRARVAFRESHCVANPPDADSAWSDGVRTDANGFPLAYAFRQQSNRAKSTTLPFQSVHHFLTVTTESGTRGVPAIAHFLNDAQDLMEIKGFLKTAIKVASTMGLTAKSAAHDSSPMAQGISAGLEMDPYSPPDDPGTGEAREEQKVSVEHVLGGGVISQKPLEVLHDARPHPNFMAFRESILREGSIGLGVPPAIMYFLDDPGGAVARIQLDMFAKFLLDQYANYLIPFCQRFWTYAISKEMKAGRLPYPSKGDFWKVRWTFPRSLTADMGKMGRLAIELRKSLMTSYSRHYEELGLHWEDEIRQCAKELRYLKDLEAEYDLAPGELTNALLPANVQTMTDAEAAAPEPGKAAA